MKVVPQNLIETIDQKSFVDIPASTPAVQFPLPKVGITNRPHYIHIQDPFTDEPNCLLSEIKVFFSLPAGQRGLHMSRIEECLHNISTQRELSLTDWLNQLAQQLLQKQEQQKCIIQLETQYEKITKKNTSQILSHELIKLHTTITKEESSTAMCIGMTVPFINACPCTQRWGMREFYKKLIDAGYDQVTAEKLMHIAPLQAHTNLGKATLKIHSADITHSQIYDLLDNSVPIVRELLKGVDEHTLVQQTHKEGQFCEDNVRAIVQTVCQRLDGTIDNNTLIEITVEIEESVHFHNLYAEVISTFADLKTDYYSL